MIKTCIIVPSHIWNARRTKLLIRCLQSLIYQTLKNDIYLSVSFETDLDKLLFTKLIKDNDLTDHHLLNIVYQDKKTSQFRHIDKLIDSLKLKYNYIMFCDDDDSYNINRTQIFYNLILSGIDACTSDKIFVGVYERDKYRHSEQFYEYWCYCIDINFIVNFMNIIKINNYDYYIDNIMCDVLFSTYLRCLDDRHLFLSTNIKLYNHDDNDFSITNKIKKKNNYNNNYIPSLTNNFEVFIQGVNKTLEDSMEDIKNNIFVRYSMSKIEYEDILQELLQNNYIYKNQINKTILDNIKKEYDNIKSLCSLLYQF